MRSEARAFTPTFSLIIALVICIGASLVLFSTTAHASEVWEDYKKPVGLTYGAQARIQTTYIWRGIYAGGANIQGDVNVGYGGLYAGMWWNIGVTDWTFNTFEPEVDLSIGFDRWGFNVFLLNEFHMAYKRPVAAYSCRKSVCPGFVDGENRP